MAETPGKISWDDRLLMLRWDKDSARTSLDEVYRYATSLARKSHDWYAEHLIPRKAWGAMLCRWGMVGFATSAAVLNVLSPVIAVPLLASLSSVSMAIAGGCLAVDRLFKFSVGHLSCARAANRIRVLLEEFRVDCQALRAAWKDDAPSAEEIQTMLESAKRFITHIHAVQEQETQEWITSQLKAVETIEQQSSPSV